MIAFGSLVGFVLVFVAVTWLLSLAAAIALGEFRDSLRRHGPRAERTAAGLALVLPPAFGVLVATVLAGHSMLNFWLGTDHCRLHGEHLHLCVVHGGPWFSKLWAVVVVAGISTILITRMARTGYALWQARARLRRIATVSAVADHVDDDVVVAPSQRVFCFVAGLRRPRVYTSRRALEHLSRAEWRAVLAHERAHIHNGDVWRTSLLSALAMTGAPVVAARCLAVWRSATERVCDQAAARATGDRASVASAMLAMSTAESQPASAFAPQPDQLDDRVRAVLEETEDGHATARRLLAVALNACAVAGVAVLLSASPLHHALETILGSL